MALDQPSVTVAQLTFALVAASAALLWLSRLFARLSRRADHQSHLAAETCTTDDGGGGDATSVVIEEGATQRQGGEATTATTTTTTPTTPTTPSLDDFLLAIVQMAALMFCFYLSEYRKVMADGRSVADGQGEERERQ